MEKEKYVISRTLDFEKIEQLICNNTTLQHFFKKRCVLFCIPTGQSSDVD